MALPKLDANPRIGDQAFEAVHAAIMNGDFPGGYRLQIRHLAAEFGTSVMPIREAIKRLEELGLVESSPYRGAVVKKFGLQELLHVYAVRRTLEIEATRLGVEQAGSGVFSSMRTSLSALESALDRGDVAAYLDADEETLTSLYSASGNPVLVETIRTLWSRCRVYKIAGARRQLDSGERGPLVEYQQRLLDAAARGDVDAAGSITADSLDAAIERIKGAIDRDGSD